MLLPGFVLGEAVICDIQYGFNNVILCVTYSSHSSKQLWKIGVDGKPESYGEDCS
jgi:hypothetical protein